MSWANDKFLYFALGVLTLLLVGVIVLNLSAQNEVKDKRQARPSAVEGLQLDTDDPASEQLLQQPADSPQQPITNLQNPSGIGEYLQYQQDGGLQ